MHGCEQTLTLGAVDRPEACAVCGGEAHARVYTLDFEGYPGPFGLWKCRDCGLVFNWPRLDARGLREQYDGGYYVFAQPPARRWSRAAQLYLEYLYPLEAAGGRLLDVGCARGDLLAIARERGWQVEGVELSAEAAEIARRENGLAVRVGTLEEHAADLEPFDVIISTDVIEHVPSPRAFVRAMRGLLRAGGQAMVETPNWGGVWRRLGGRRWIGINRFHVYLFDAASLTRLMRACGFQYCEARSATHAAYAEWGSRPELSALDWLPAGLRWRARRALNRMTPWSVAVELCRRPPCSLAEALERVEALKGESCARGPRGWGDNLCVIGRG